MDRSGWGSQVLDWGLDVGIEREAVDAQDHLSNKTQLPAYRYQRMKKVELEEKKFLQFRLAVG